MPQRRCKVAVVTDSTSSLTQAMGRALGIQVLPLYLLSDGQLYRDGVDLDSASFYKRLRARECLPTTSRPSVDDFVRVYRSLSQQADAIVSIHLSHEMSGTLDSALSASRQLPGLPIHVIDSRSMSMGLGLLAMAAARDGAAGEDVLAVVQHVEELIPRMNMLFTLDSLDYLHKGGRMGGAATLLGSVLEIKPVLYVKDGRIELLERQRTRQRAIARIVNLMGERADSSKPVRASIFHCAALAEAQELANQVRARLGGVELSIAETGQVIGTHLGLGALGLAFYADG